MKEKVFIVSMPKAGTTSITDFLKNYGYNAMHWIGSKVDVKSLKIGEAEFFINFAEAYDVCSDSPFHVLYPLLDKRYANSKFIFVDRNVTEWLNSTVKHRLKSGREFGHLEHNALTEEEMRYFDGKGVLSYDEKSLQENYFKHKEKVIKYFEGRENFLIINLEDREIGQKICSFLNIKYNYSKKFPKLNVAPN